MEVNDWLPHSIEQFLRGVDRIHAIILSPRADIPQSFGLLSLVLGRDRLILIYVIN